MNFSSWRGTESILYTPANDGFALSIRDDIHFQISPVDRTGLAFDRADIVAAQSNDRFTVYEKVVGDRTLRLLAYRPGSGNGELALSYASFVHLQTIDRSIGAPRDAIFDAYLPYGVVTPTDQMPRSGTATYSGRLYGTGTPRHDFDANWNGPRPLDFYTLTGTANFTADFAAGRLKAVLHPIGVNVTTGATRDFGVLPLDYSFAVGTSRFGGTDYQQGFFFGPTANEVAVTFRRAVEDSLSSAVLLTGVAVGKRD